MAVFLVAWTVMFAACAVRIGVDTPPVEGLLTTLAAVSVACFLTGYALSRLAWGALTTPRLGAEPVVAPPAPLDPARLQLAIQGLVALAVLMSLAYLVTDGLPPMFAAFGLPVEHDYVSYGTLKGLLYAAVAAIGVLAALHPSPRVFLLGVGFAAMVYLVNIARGPLIYMMLQVTFVYLITRPVKMRHVFQLAILGTIALFALTFVLGEIRYSREEFVSQMMVARAYADWPIAFIGVVAYMSLPASNLIWFISSDIEHTGGNLMLNSMLPRFLADPHWANYSADLPNPANTVATYLGMPVIDFGWHGVWSTNLVLGAIGGLLYSPAVRRLWPGLLAVYLAALTLLCFDNIFLLRATVGEVILLLLLAPWLWRRTERHPARARWVAA